MEYEPKPFTDKEMSNFDRKVAKYQREEKQKEILRLREQNTEKIAEVEQTMRMWGANEKSIKLAVQGWYEYLKILPIPDNVGRKQYPAPDREEAIGDWLSDFETRPINWLWPNRIPFGKITILEGDPGLGKSLLAAQIAACVSSGNPMPDSTPCSQGGVILIAPEDGAADTLKPRIEAAGGDPSKILLLNTVEYLNMRRRKIRERPFVLSQDLHILEERIRSTKATLVVIDPLMAALGRSTDSSSDQSIRAALTPLGLVAEYTNCAVLVIRHLNKGSSSNPLYRGSGSIGIIAAARVGLLIVKDPDDEQKCILATTKNNLSITPPNLTFQVQANQHGIPCIQWLGENQLAVTTLIRDQKQSALSRQILAQLKLSSEPLGAKEVTELTQQNYQAVRRALSRMHTDREIKTTARGLYTHLDHPDNPNP